MQRCSRPLYDSQTPHQHPNKQDHQPHPPGAARA